jgi:hypothetical protein
MHVIVSYTYQWSGHQFDSVLFRAHISLPMSYNVLDCPLSQNDRVCLDQGEPSDGRVGRYTNLCSHLDCANRGTRMYIIYMYTERHTHRLLLTTNPESWVYVYYWTLAYTLISTRTPKTRMHLKINSAHTSSTLDTRSTSTHTDMIVGSAQHIFVWR